MKDEEFQKLLAAPVPLILILSPIKLMARAVCHLAVSLGVLAFGWFLFDRFGHGIGWIIVVLPCILFGVAGLVGLIQTMGILLTILHYDKAKVVLNDIGFSVYDTRLIEKKYKWQDVSDFVAGGMASVVFDDSVSYDPDRPDDSSRVVQDVAGLSAKELTRLLNHWRTRALQSG